MDMIPQFQTLPIDIVDNILMMVPWEGQREKRQNCMDQLINMRECLQDYRAGRRAYTDYTYEDGCVDWNDTRITYVMFALHKIEMKKKWSPSRHSDPENAERCTDEMCIQSLIMGKDEEFMSWLDETSLFGA